jgi:transcriptional regulator with XRE-family HTH domain
MDRERAKALKKMLGANIRLARLRQGLTQEAAAELIGISTEVYGRLERGGIYPRVVRLMDICEHFKVSADQLLGLAAMERSLPTVEVAPRQDEWFMVIHRFMSVLPKLTQAQRLAARRHLADFHRVLLAFVDPGAKVVVKKRKNKSPPPPPP